MTHHSHRRVRIAKRVCVLASAVAAFALTTACEERIVEARGLGADSYQIQEPMYEQPTWERAIMGDNRPKPRDVYQKSE